VEGLAQNRKQCSARARVRPRFWPPAPHNTQPWLFKITNFFNRAAYRYPRGTSARLDPYLREEHIGIGCALENLMLGRACQRIRSHGPRSFRENLARFPAAPKPQLLGPRESHTRETRRKTSFTTPSPRRHTNRGPYDPLKAIFARFRRRTQPSAERLRKCKAIPLHG